MSGLKQFAHLNARLRARISIILDEDFFRRAERLRTLPEAVHLFKGTDLYRIEEIYRESGDIRMVELELFHRELGLYTEMNKFLDGNVLAFISALTLHYEVIVLKNVLRLWFDRKLRGRNIENAVLYLYRDTIFHSLDIDTMINAENTDELIRSLADTPYADIVRKHAERLNKEKNIFFLEAELENYYFKGVFAAMKGLDREDARVATRLVGVEADLINISRLIRLKILYKIPREEILALCIPHGRNVSEKSLSAVYTESDPAAILSGMISSSYPALRPLLTTATGDNSARLLMIERILEEVLLIEVRRVLTGKPFNIGIVLSWFILKRNELRKVMALLNRLRLETLAEAGI